MTPLQLITLSVKNFLLEVYQNLKPKDFVHKRQLKQTSAVMEPPIPFHTLVELVDAEDITNGRYFRLDLPLEIIKITFKLAF